jgi:hypothetical protein
MNVKQQLNNSFFALFIGALLIGAKETQNFEHVDIKMICLFFFLFFLRLKLYLDDNVNFNSNDQSSNRKDFIFGYLTTMMSWIIFPIAAYRVWDEASNISILFISISLVFASLWTFSAAYVIEPKESHYKMWLKNNVFYLIFLGLIVLNNNINSIGLRQDLRDFNSVILTLILIVGLYFDYIKSNTFTNIKL